LLIAVLPGLRAIEYYYVTNFRVFTATLSGSNLKLTSLPLNSIGEVNVRPINNCDRECSIQCVFKKPPKVDPLLSGKAIQSTPHSITFDYVLSPHTVKATIEAQIASWNSRVNAPNVSSYNLSEYPLVSFTGTTQRLLQEHLQNNANQSILWSQKCPTWKNKRLLCTLVVTLCILLYWAGLISGFIFIGSPTNTTLAPTMVPPTPSNTTLVPTIFSPSPPTGNFSLRSYLTLLIPLSLATLCGPLIALLATFAVADAITESTILSITKSISHRWYAEHIKETKISELKTICISRNLKDGSGSITSLHVPDIRLVEELIWQLYFNNLSPQK